MESREQSQISQVSILSSANNLMRQNNFSEAEILFSQLLTHLPTNAVFLCNRGICRYHLNRKKEAYEDLNNALRISRDLPDAWRFIGQIFKDQNNFVEANKAFSEAEILLTQLLTQQPTNAALLCSRGVCRYHLNRKTEAFEDLNNALRISRDLPDAWNIFGQTYLEQKSFEEALKAFSEVLKYRPADYNALFNRALVYEMKEEFQKAADEHIRLISTYPDNSNLHSNLGLIYTKMKQIQKALDEYEDAIRLDPRSPTPRYNRGSAWKSLGYRYLSYAEADYLKAKSLYATEQDRADCDAQLKIINDMKAKMAVEPPPSALPAPMDVEPVAPPVRSYIVAVNSAQATAVRNETDYLKESETLPEQLRKIPIRLWDHEQVMEWIYNLGPYFRMPETRQFRKNLERINFNGLLLLQITADDLEELQLSGVLPSRRLLQGIARLKSLDDYYNKCQNEQNNEMKNKYEEQQSKLQPHMT